MRVTRNNISKKVFRLKDFRGVDYSSSPLEVQPYRSTDMANFILRDGVLHKRNGFEYIFKAVPGEILNAWAFGSADKYILRVCEDFEAEEDEAQPEQYSKFYAVNLKEKTVKYIGEAFAVGIENASRYREATALYKNGALYILCGAFIKYYETEENGETVGHLEQLGDVSDRATGSITKNAYIPTTTINILRFNSTQADVFKRSTNEYINLLSPWQKNELISDAIGIVPSKSSFQLDSVVYQQSKEDYEAYGDDSAFAKNAAPVITARLGALEPVTVTLKPYGNADNRIWTWGQTTNGYALRMYLGTPKALKANKITVEGKNETNSVLYVEQFNPFLDYNNEESGYVVGDLKITVEFLRQDRVKQDTKVISGKANKVDALKHYDLQFSRFGAIFGVDGADDRLFVAGTQTVTQEAKENTVYYSENNNFEYFPAINMIVCGEESSSICAFEKISDGTLAVFKDIKDTREVGVYYISGRHQSLGTGEEGNPYYVEIFSVSAGNINESGISAKSTYNLAGDNLFVSNNGVFSLVLSENSASMERYARARSRTINAKLKEFDLSQAKAIVHDNKYYLAVGGNNNEVYVADARYKYNTEGDLYGAYSYEWFRFTGIPVSTWFLWQNELWFGTKDGWLCKFHNGFTDIYETDEGDMTVMELNENEYGVVFNESILPIIQAAAYAVDTNGNHWEVGDVHTYTDESGNELHYIPVPSYITVSPGAIVLKFHIPIYAYWKSAIVDFDKSYARKNLWSISASVMPVSRGRLTMGYKTRLSESGGIDIDGTNAFNFGDIDFTNFSFDCGGFVNAYRVPVFERGFIYLQLMFSSHSDGDAVVNELAVEYSETVKNIGVG